MGEEGWVDWRVLGLVCPLPLLLLLEGGLVVLGHQRLLSWGDLRLVCRRLARPLRLPRRLRRLLLGGLVEGG